MSRVSRMTAMATTAVALAAWHVHAAEHVRHGIVTVVDLATCTRRDTPDGIKSWRCRGLPGYPVYVSQRGDGYLLAVVAGARQPPAAAQALPVASTVLEAKTRRATIEWRTIRGPGNRPKPYATIVRHFTTGPGGTQGEVLAVSRVGEKNCFVAFIDALANPDATALARQVADTRGRSQDCAQPPTVEGATGKSPM